MVGICKMAQWQHSSICWQQAGRNIRRFIQNYQPDKINLQVSALIIKYLVAVSFG